MKINYDIASHQKKSHKALSKLPFSKKAKMALASYAVIKMFKELRNKNEK
jgi:hypothetical protein